METIYFNLAQKEMVILSLNLDSIQLFINWLLILEETILSFIVHFRDNLVIIFFTLSPLSI